LRSYLLLTQNPRQSLTVASSKMIKFPPAARAFAHHESIAFNAPKNPRGRLSKLPHPRRR
jgi:hypothetical protein